LWLFFLFYNNRRYPYQFYECFSWNFCINKKCEQICVSKQRKNENYSNEFKIKIRCYYVIILFAIYQTLELSAKSTHTELNWDKTSERVEDENQLPPEIPTVNEQFAKRRRSSKNTHSQLRLPEANSFLPATSEDRLEMPHKVGSYHRSLHLHHNSHQPSKHNSNYRLGKYDHTKDWKHVSGDGKKYLWWKGNRKEEH
jgi:hypothetical protein